MALVTPNKEERERLIAEIIDKRPVKSQKPTQCVAPNNSQNSSVVDINPDNLTAKLGVQTLDTIEGLNSNSKLHTEFIERFDEIFLNIGIQINTPDAKLSFRDISFIDKLLNDNTLNSCQGGFSVNNNRLMISGGMLSGSKTPYDFNNDCTVDCIIEPKNTYISHKMPVEVPPAFVEHIIDRQKSLLDTTDKHFPPLDPHRFINNLGDHAKLDMMHQSRLYLDGNGRFENTAKMLRDLIAAVIKSSDDIHLTLDKTNRVLTIESNGEKANVGVVTPHQMDRLLGNTGKLDIDSMSHS